MKPNMQESEAYKQSPNPTILSQAALDDEMVPDYKSENFIKNAETALQNEQLRKNMRFVMDSLMTKRLNAMPDAVARENLRILGQQIKARALSKLPDLLELLEANLERNGIKVHWAATKEQANEIVLAIAKQHKAKNFIKGKSMVTEEIELNHYLEAHGADIKESDMGEFIIQLNNERPSHIIGPALHKNAQQIGRLFNKHLNCAYTDDIDELIQLGRKTLREKFFAAEIGISGVNFLIAETGTLLLVENEGNGLMSTTAPPVHIAITGIEKVVETLDDSFVLLSLLTKSALGLDITTYVNLISKPRQANELDGPNEVHLILLDNGRTQAFSDPEFRQTLACIRCGACMNHCPVYTRIGGQAYGTTYPGPIGKILSPHLLGLEATKDLPFASSLCGACGEVCPVKIPIPQLLINLRAAAIGKPNTKIEPKGTGARASTLEKLLWRSWSIVNKYPRIYKLTINLISKLRYLTPYNKAWQRNHTKFMPAKKNLHSLIKQREQRHDIHK